MTIEAPVRAAQALPQAPVRPCGSQQRQASAAASGDDDIDSGAQRDQLGAGAHVQRVRTGASLGHPVRADEVPRHHPGQVRLLLRGGAERHQRHLDAPHLRVEGKEEPIVVAPVSQGLHDQGCR